MSEQSQKSEVSVRRRTASPAAFRSRTLAGLTAAGVVMLPGCSSDLVPSASDTSASTTTPAAPTTSFSSPTATAPSSATTTPRTSGPKLPTVIPAPTASPTTAPSTCEVIEGSDDPLLIRTDWDMGRESDHLDINVDINSLSPDGGDQYLVVFEGSINGTQVEVALDPSKNLLLVTRYGTEDLNQILPGGFALTHNGGEDLSKGDPGVLVKVPLPLQIGRYTFGIDVGSNSSFNGGPEQSSIDIYLSSTEYPGTNHVANVRVPAPAPGVTARIAATGMSSMTDWGGEKDPWDVTVYPFTVVPDDLRGPVAVDVTYGDNPANATVNPDRSVRMQAGSGVERCNDPGSVTFLQSTASIAVPTRGREMVLN